MKNKVLLIGSLNMDFTTYMDKAPEAGQTISGNSFSMSSGGKGLNQAIALSRARANVSMVGAVGNDSIGNELIDILEREHIVNLVKRCDSPSGTAFIFVEKCGQNRIVIIHGANYELTFEDIKEAIDKSDYQYVCFQLENPIDVVEKGIKYAKEKGKIVVLNPAPAVKLNKDIFQYIDIFTPNETELSFYVDGEEDLSIASKKILDMGIKNLIVTLGEKGALIVNKDTHQLVPAIKVKAIDTVAAGDCFNGYLIASLAKGLDMIKAIKVANKAASIAVTRLGAANSIPYLDEVE